MSPKYIEPVVQYKGDRINAIADKLRNEKMVKCTGITPDRRAVVPDEQAVNLSLKQQPETIDRESLVNIKNYNTAIIENPFISRHGLKSRELATGKQSIHLTRLRHIHCSNNSYPCPDCGKAFLYPSALKSHYRTHNGEKPYPCPDCGKAFIRPATLTRHQRTHSGEKPYSCPDVAKLLLLAQI